MLRGCAGAAIASSLFVGGAAHAATESDAQLLVPVAGTELLAAFVYQRLLDSGIFSPRGDRLAQRLLDAEHAHARAIATELGRLGGTPPPPFTNVTEAERVLSAHQVPERLGELKSEHDAIILLARIEWMLEGAYYGAIQKLTSPRLLRLSAQVMASEAQHGTMLSELLHPGDVNKAVPSPAVTGTR